MSHPSPHTARRRNYASTLIACILLWFAFNARAADIAHLTDITVSAPSQIVLTFNQAPVYKAFTLPHPDRLVLDLQNTQYAFTGGKAINFSSTPVRNFRHGVHGGYNLRIVFDLKNAINFNISTKPAGKNAQIILNLSESGSAILAAAAPPALPTVSSPASAPATKPARPIIPVPPPVLPTPVLPPEAVMAPSPPPKKPAAPKPIAKPAIPEPLPVVSSSVPTPAHIPAPAPVPTASAPLSSLPAEKHKFIVVIDAGHGGKDPGAIGPDGTKEKNITLSIARELQHLVNTQPGMQAVMTRKGDYYVGLRQRLKIARKSQGDMFVAIHADTFNDTHAQGVSVFALSLHGASSEAALWLAKKENYSELGGIDLNNIQYQDTQIRSVLIDLSQTATINASVKLGRNLLQELGSITELHHGRVEQAPFMVLKSPDIPSVLIETGFLSNPKEDARLQTKAYQQKLAYAIMAGITAYYQQSNPRNLAIAVPHAKLYNLPHGSSP